MKRHLSPLLILCVCAAPAACDEAASDVEADAGRTSDAESSSSTGEPGQSGASSSPDPSTSGPGGGSSGPGTSGVGSTGNGESGEAPDDTQGETTGASACGADGVPCEDAMILDLGLVAGTVSEGAVSNTADGDGWTTTVDATAGGVVDAPSNPWVYLRFTNDGLERVALDDLQALESQDWDIAAKRFAIRLNSGSGGPGCARVATLVDEVFESVEELPDDASFRAEAFYDEGCGLIDDGSGAGGASYALSQWWFYPGCVGVTYVPFVIETNDGRHVKFMVESYYESGQAECNDSGAMGSGSANFTWRWAYLDG